MKINVLGTIVFLLAMMSTSVLGAQSSEDTQAKVQELKKEIQEIRQNTELSHEERQTQLAAKKEEMTKLRDVIRAENDKKRALAKEERAKKREQLKAEIKEIKENPDLSQEEKEALISEKRGSNGRASTDQQVAKKERPKSIEDRYKEHIAPMKAEIEKINANEELSDEEKKVKTQELRDAYRKSWKGKSQKKKEE